MTTVTRTECGVADQIVPWHEVQEGDAVLFAGRLRLLVAMWPAMIPDAPDLIGVRLLDEGETRDVTVNSNSLTAVRRYVETEPDSLREQVQQARNDYHEAGCDHSDMTGHGAQEERAWGAVQALDEVLGWLDGTQ